MIWAKIAAFVLGLFSWMTEQWDKYRERRGARIESDKERLESELEAYREANEVESHIDRLTPAEREQLLRSRWSRDHD